MTTTTRSSRLYASQESSSSRPEHGRLADMDGVGKRESSLNLIGALRTLPEDPVLSAPCKQQQPDKRQLGPVKHVEQRLESELRE